MIHATVLWRIDCLWTSGKRIRTCVITNHVRVIRQISLAVFFYEDGWPPSIYLIRLSIYIDVVFMHYRIRSARRPRLGAFRSGNVRLTSSVSSSFSLVNLMVHRRMFFAFSFFSFYFLGCSLFFFFTRRSWRFSLIGKNRWCNNHLEQQQPKLRNKLDSHG